MSPPHTHTTVMGYHGCRNWGLSKPKVPLAVVGQNIGLHAASAASTSSSTYLFSPFQPKPSPLHPTPFCASLLFCLCIIQYSAQHKTDVGEKTYLALGQGPLWMPDWLGSVHLTPAPSQGFGWGEGGLWVWRHWSISVLQHMEKSFCLNGVASCACAVWCLKQWK